MSQILSILENLERLNYEISTESRLVRVGLKEEQNMRQILSKYPVLTQLEVFLQLKDQASRQRDPDLKERLERLAFSCLEWVLHAQVVALDDQMETFLSRATAEVIGEKISYHDLYPRIQKEKDFAKRELLGTAAQTIHQQGNPYLIQMLEKELDFLKKSAGFSDYISYCQEKKKFDYSKFRQPLWNSQKRTASFYHSHMQRWLDQTIQKPLGSTSRWHASYLLKIKQFDDLFPQKGFLKRIGRTFSALGIDLDSYKNIHVDMEERPRKNPRACCYGSKIPQEIHLIMKPVGGHSDYETFLHEAGHALHNAHTAPGLPYEYRHLSRSNALSETYAFLLQNVTMNDEWLKQLMEIDRLTARRIRYYRILIDLYMFRRYVGKFTAELEFFQKEDLRNGRGYSSLLTELTEFTYDPVSYLFDMDEEFYSADYLRAWIAEAQLEQFLIQQSGPSWWSNRKTKDLLMDFWSRGEKQEPEELIQELGMKPFDLSPLEARFVELDDLV